MQSPHSSTVNQIRSTNHPTSVLKPPHCPLCGHKGHGCHKETSITGERVINCSNCPNQICCQGGGGALCLCSWCSPRNFSSSSTSLGAKGTLHTAPCTPHVVFQNQRDVTEWILPVCQSNVAGQSGSNACTITAVLSAINFYYQVVWSSQVQKNSLSQAFVSMVKEIMIQRNILHQWLGCSNRNFSAQEVIQHPVLGVSTVARRGDEYQFTSFQQFAVELTTIDTSQQRKHAAVIILPLDNSMLFSLKK